MRRRMNPTAVFPFVMASFLLLAASAESPPQHEVDDGIDLGFREVEILSTAPQAQETYPDSAAGESKKLERAYPGAPPQIPHEVESMLPITRETNDCLDCHLPENAKDKKDVPTPKSHFQRPIIAEGKPGEAMATVVKGYKAQKELLGTRYNCDMCHVPQAADVKSLPTTFRREVSTKP